MIRSSALVIAALVLQPPAAVAAKPSSSAAAMAAKSEIGDLFADYGFAADQRDPEAVSALFAEDGMLAIPVVNIEARGRDAIASSFRKTWEPVAAAGQQRRHVISGLRLTSGVGKERGFRAIMTVVGTARDGTPQLYVNGYYTGIAVLTAQGWRFKRLEIRVDTPR